MIRERIQVTPIAFDIAVPMEAVPEKSYIAGQLVQDEARYWRVKRNGEFSLEKHNTPEQALAEMIETIEAVRLKMLNEEFERRAELQEFA